MAPSLVEFRTADIVQDWKGKTARLGSVRGTVECDAHLGFCRDRMVDILSPGITALRRLGCELSKGQSGEHLVVPLSDLQIRKLV